MPLPADMRLRAPTRLPGYRTWALAAMLLGLVAAPVGAAELAEVGDLFYSGQYEQCAEAAGQAVEAGIWNEAWPRWKIRADMALGRYSEALKTLEDAQRRYTTSITLRLLARDVYRFNDLPVTGRAMLRQVEDLARQAPWRYGDPSSRVMLGRALLLLGADARQVLELFYEPVRKQHPELAEAHLAAGDLALGKYDDALAAEAYEIALEHDSANPDVYYRLARALASGDARRSDGMLQAALEINPRHVDSLLYQVDDHVDEENYAAAAAGIAAVLAVNPREPRAWAYRAVLARLDGDLAVAEACRREALRPWSTNPEVDHLIGRKLSQKYRFAEGAEHQRLALALDADYLPAMFQLSQDLLRLGQTDEGWRLAHDVHQRDGYHVVAYNLVTLHDNLGKFRTLESPGFVVRMEAREAEVYGPRVLNLLARASDTLCAKYGVKLTDPVHVEIFPRQQDFAIRTFGLPGGAGFLGVCFGRVITANSPASQGASPSNWESVLWHEFCHVVTLEKTRNKMPRWLSEGISVYEERQANPAWGQDLTPRFREMVLGGELTPVSQLSGAFLSPPSPAHLQFAYYESSLVVEYLLARHGPGALARILGDLADDIPINHALARHAGKLEELDAEFAEFARRRAEELAPGLDWQQPDLAPRASAAEWAAWNAAHPDNYHGLLGWAGALVAERRWQDAKAPLQRLVGLYGPHGGAGGAYALLAEVHRRLGETETERAVLEEVARSSDDAVDAYLRLMELAAEAGQWEAVVQNAERMLAVNPLVAAPHRYLARAAEQLDQPSGAIAAYRALLLLADEDVVDTHFRLARLLADEGDLAAARRHVLQSLEEAPRWREAQQLLLAIVDRGGAEPRAAAAASPTDDHSRPEAAAGSAPPPAAASSGSKQ